MRLVIEELAEVEPASEAIIDEILESDAFGKFAILSAANGGFVRTASVWDPSPECERFLKQHGSDPWILEHKANSSSNNSRARGFHTLKDVQRAFKSFIRAEKSWVSDFSWEPASE